jgi:imidazolonepropionase-like amidohydrolase
MKFFSLFPTRLHGLSPTFFPHHAVILSDSGPEKSEPVLMESRRKSTVILSEGREATAVEGPAFAFRSDWLHNLRAYAGCPILAALFAARVGDHEGKQSAVILSESEGRVDGPAFASRISSRQLPAVALAFLITFVSLLPAQPPTAPKVIALTGGRLLTVSHGAIDNGTLLMADGKIAAVGEAGKVKIPSGAQIVDAKGMTIYPGLIDPESNFGLTEISADQMSNDLVERSDEIMPHMHVYDAFHSNTELIPVARLNGITNAVVAPASDNTISGQDIFIQLYGADRDQMILGRDLALAMNFGADQRRRGGRGGGGGGISREYPSTRMGLITQLRQTFLDVQDYVAKKEAASKKDDKAFKIDLRLEALIPYLKGERPVVIGVYEGYDVETIMTLAQEFHLKVILNHVTHSQDVLDKIASYKVPVIIGSIYDFPRADQRFDAVYTLPAELAKRGVKIAISSADAGGPVSSHSSRNLPYAAGFAVAYGLPYDDALKAITLNVADMFGFGDRLGSLDVGKLANVVVANGDPLDVRTDVKQVYIQGVPVPMVTRQTQLRDEYSK